MGADPETRQTTNGKTVCSIRLASKERNGTEWLRVELWGKDAEFVQNFLKKGDLVAVEGRLQTRKWQDKDGNDRYTTECVASSVEGFGGKPTEDVEERPF
jgi:single-strand DNA-binding protein